jgi:phosphoribosylformimino-5-aminoimidazole carboxamide ribotide isomerase
VVLGLETITGPVLLREILDSIGSEAVWFSLDLKHGQPLVRSPAWQGPTAEAIIDQVMSIGVGRIIVLDLAHVGEKRGTGTESLCSGLISRYQGLELAVGGGVRDRADLARLESLGVTASLVATALHELMLP